MGFFFAGFGTGPSMIPEIGRSFAEVIPPEIKNDVRRVEGSTSFLVSYGSDKVIPDVIIHDEDSGSWLALLGTPLTSWPKEERGAVLTKFFCAPTDFIKDGLDGCFALLAYDAATGAVYAATDYNNTTPIFYASTPSGIFLSSHELPLARYLGSEIDPLGFSMTIHLKLTWGTLTRFKNIRKLLPCQILIFRNGRPPSSAYYWSPAEESQWPSDFDETIDRWLALLKDSLQAYYSRSRNKVVICEFTGGEDSRLLLSACHFLGIPFFAMVDGQGADPDVLVAKEAARKTGFNLVIRAKPQITEAQLLQYAVRISLRDDAYQDYFASCSLFAIDEANPPGYYDHVKFCGAPGGEAFRGSYYLRGKAFFPSSRRPWDSRFFTKMKFLLDFHPGLLKFPDVECQETLLALAEQSGKDVAEFPVGIRIDHLIRMFQTSNAGLIYKNPRYLPFATKGMTRTVYNLPPHFKRGGRLTKACTELLFPELAFVKTLKGVPTVRKTPRRIFLFLPEHIATVRAVASGAASRLFKWTESNKLDYQWSRNAATINALLKTPPYANWFSSSESMITGHLYNGPVVDSLLGEAKSGGSRYVPILGRILNQELACRWVRRQTHPL
jgi:hypothetical protein